MASYKLYLPKMGESVAEATIIKWVKQPGDYVYTDEAVLEIATDKVDSDVPSPVSGKLVTQYYKVNDVVPVGSLIAVIETNEPEVYVPYQPEPEKYTPPVFEERAVFEPQKTEVKYNPFENTAGDKLPSLEEVDENQVRFYSPLVRNIAANEGIGYGELIRIPGSGADGRLTKDDLIRYINNKKAGIPNTEIPQPVYEPVKVEPVVVPPTIIHTEESPKIEYVFEIPKTEPVYEIPVVEVVPEVPLVEVAPVIPVVEVAAELPKVEPVVVPEVKVAPVEIKPEPAAIVSGGDEIIEMDRMRRLTAEHMVMSKHVSPHVTSFVEVDVTNLVSWRERMKSGFEKREGEKITFTPIFIEAVVRSLKDFPMVNISVSGTQIIKKKDINIGMATALPNGNLIVPVIKKADGLSLTGLTKEVNKLANLARNNKLKPDDVQGGTFTITNVGSFGNVMGTPIINQPQVAILAIGVIRKKPAVIETIQGDMIGIRHMMFLSLSYDHRVVDGALGGMFVKRIADYLENWDTDREV